jgi:hypothetical protein
MVESNVSDEAASTVPPLITAGSTKLKSSVWADFEYKVGEGGAAAATATCRWCHQTLCAGGRNGTTHLRRHTESKKCQARAEERRRQPTTAPAAAAGPSLGDQEALYFVDGLNIPQLFDELDAQGLVHINPPASDDAHFWPNCMPILLLFIPSIEAPVARLAHQCQCSCAVPQRANSSSRWFFQKTKEKGKCPSRFLSFASMC